MKKFMLVLFAAALAISFSAFSPEKKPVTTYYYWDGDSYEVFTGTPCENPGTVICKRPLASGGPAVTVLKSQNINDPLRYDGQ